MEEVQIIKKATCPSLSGRSELTYEFGHHDKSILFRIIGNTGAGHFSTAWIPLDDILKCLQEAPEPFSLSAFRSLYPGLSINNTGFLGAVLKKEGLVICEKRQYLKKDSKTFVAELYKLVKPAPKKTPVKRTVKKS